MQSDPLRQRPTHVVTIPHVIYAALNRGLLEEKRTPASAAPTGSAAAVKFLVLLCVAH
jgi:hypothetical protein